MAAFVGGWVARLAGAARAVYLVDTMALVEVASFPIRRPFSTIEHLPISNPQVPKI